MSRRKKKFRRMAILPIDAILGIWQNIRELFDLVMSITGLRHRQPRRYNRDFEKAGREVPHVDNIDSKSLRLLEAATKTREDEIIRQVAYERKTLGRKNAQAQQLREQMETDSRSVSQGGSISHLARMNEEARKKRAKKEPSES